MRLIFYGCEENFSTNVGWIYRKCGSDIHIPIMMNYKNRCRLSNSLVYKQIPGLLKMMEKCEMESGQ